MIDSRTFHLIGSSWETVSALFLLNSSNPEALGARREHTSQNAILMSARNKLLKGELTGEQYSEVDKFVRFEREQLIRQINLFLFDAVKTGKMFAVGRTGYFDPPEFVLTKDWSFADKKPWESDDIQMGEKKYYDLRYFFSPNMNHGLEDSAAILDADGLNLALTDAFRHHLYWVLVKLFKSNGVDKPEQEANVYFAEIWQRAPDKDAILHEWNNIIEKVSAKFADGELFSNKVAESVQAEERAFAEISQAKAKRISDQNLKEALGAVCLYASKKEAKYRTGDKPNFKAISELLTNTLAMDDRESSEGLSNLERGLREAFAEMDSNRPKIPKE